MQSSEPFPEPLPALDREERSGDAPPRRLIRCRLCGRPLTGADSRRTGLGPSCDAKLHPPPPDIRTRRHEVEQDTLPGT
ncbi:DUF6011 domain-containing protein [Streptomyces bacillaris]|uniref:RNHCP domain-containing protein n=1 Tax=Streptomyces rhizosphaericola TaxID=2564098 RepID=A0ABY2PGW3_9ACTN|nr:hypothetical protein A6E92_28760 [Streptomyces sp. S8]MYT94808.1 hypothetical protein [Streptomyces sp. SID8359]MYT99178.1 hypothetical protein [Streptomyces sp. SID8350]TGZ10158.1 hypothetical protein E5Z02_11440 [Streptomyces rhizosphaericola]SCK43791.1 hypothetical protein YUWDRAFT_03737 [Streptomyces sp. AmelKG-D3]